MDCNIDLKKPYEVDDNIFVNTFTYSIQRFDYFKN